MLTQRSPAWSPGAFASNDQKRSFRHDTPHDDCLLYCRKRENIDHNQGDGVHMAPSLAVGSDSFLGHKRMRQSRNQTHVWVRTDMVEAILDNHGTLPRGWTPLSRKRSRSSNKLAWGWTRAYLVPQTVSATSTPEMNTSLFGHVTLRRVKNSTSITPHKESAFAFHSPNNKGPEWSQSTSMTVTIHDEEFAPQHLQNVTVTLDPSHESAPLCMANSWWCETDCKPPDDLTTLTHLHEPAVVFCLQRRYEQDAIYTYTGKILLALNPFRECKKLYGDDVMKEYGKAATGERPPPHIYAIAQDAYDCMMRAMQMQNGSENQSVLVSGESGAGKTVTTKIIMQYLATLSRNHLSIKSEKQTEFGDIESQVLQSNPILESFGNARTVRNDNSSRFGKFIEIQFLSTGCLVSASIETYLLEKVRLITQAPGERNYHIFYELLAGAPQKDRRDLKIGNVTARDFRITASSGTFDRRDGVDDRETYRELLAALDTVGFTKQEQVDLFTVVCALLHASNLTFLSTSAESCELDRSNPSLRSTHTLLGVPPEKLQAALCSCAIEARGETLFKNMSMDQATKALDALIKATYGALFTHLVRRINSSITVRHDGGGGSSSSSSPPVHGESRMASIGVLDIFGFESFDLNSFEQLCINYCNEALQQQFNKFVFKLEQQEYEREGIEWSFISFPDNQDVLDLIETKRTGILSILDEQCRLPTCTDMSFARATYEKCCDHPRFTASNYQKVSGAFSVHHYAGLVEYNTANFLEKNKDELPKETTELLMSSERPFLASLGKLLRNQPMEKLQSPPSSVSNGVTPAPRQQLRRQSSSLMRESVGSQFASQLGELRNRINQTTPHYVRCLKPNDDLLPDSFHPMVIADQLRCAGVLEAIRVSRVGFPQRYAHDAFIHRYYMLAIHELQQKSSFLQGKDLCEVLVKRALRLVWQMQNGGSLSEDSSPLSKSGPSCDNVEVGIQMGLSKVFLRRQAFDSLELLRGMRLEKAATKIQSVARMAAARLQRDITIAAIVILQTFARRMEATRYFNKLRRQKAATRIQCTWRFVVAGRRFVAVIWIARWCQCYYRGSKARELFALLLLEHVVTIVQKHWRAFIAVRRYRTILWIVVRLQTLYRGLKARQVLKQLQVEARDVHVLKAERDRFREEALRLRRELEAKEEKQRELLAQMNGHANKSVPAVERREFETPPRKEKITKYKKEIQLLAALSAEKDAELAKLRDEIAFLRSPEGISIIHEQLSFVSSPARSQNAPEKAIHTADGQDRSFIIDNPWFRKAVHEGDDTYVPSPERFRNTPERTAQTIRSGGRSPTRTNRSLFSTKSSPARSERSRGCFSSPALGLSLLDAVGLGDTKIMGVSPMSKDERRDNTEVSWPSVSMPLQSQITPEKAIFTVSNRVDVGEDRVRSTDGQHKSFSIDALRFRKAVHDGDSETVEKFLRESNLCDTLINECDEIGRSPLHVAVIESRWKVVGALLGNDAAANAQDLAGNTPLHVASSASMMALLLKEGRANPNIPNMNGECALHLAVKKLDDAAVEVLLQHRANVNCADNLKWYTPIHLIAQADLDERAHLELLQDEFEDEKHKRVRIANLLCGANDPFLFPCEPDLNYQDWEGNTPLHHVVMLTSEPAGEMLTIFLERGAKPQIVNNRGQTALHLLCHNDSLRKLEVFQEMLHDMLYHGADPNHTSLTGCTALHLSLYHRDVSSAIQLVNSGAELHLLWRKPKRWLSFWDDMGMSEILALDMVDDEHTLHRILAAINRPQKWAPSRPWCMQCKSMFGSFARALHCRHCGRLVCGACAPRVLAAQFFPKSFQIYEPSWVCVVCEKILVGWKEDNSSTTQPTTSIHDDDDERISF